MTKTTRLCIQAGLIYALLLMAAVVVLRRVIPDEPFPDLTLCPFCHK
jgi:hypothetical protein